MIDSALYVFDDTFALKSLIQYCIRKNIGNIFLCSLTSDQDSLSLIIKCLTSLTNCKVEVIPFLEHFNKLAFLERDNFVRFISELAQKPRFGRKNFKEYFKYPHSSFSVWWLSLISEKNPLKSDSFLNLIKLLTILKLRNVYKCQNIILDIKSAELSCTLIQDSRNGHYDCEDFKKHRMWPQVAPFLINFLKAMKYYLYSIYKRFIIAINSRGLDFRKEILKNAQYLAITYFPLIDKESLKNKRFINKYYGLLQQALENKYKDKLIWLGMAPCIDGFSFKGSIKLGRQINMWNYPIYFLEEWITLKDFFIIIANYIYFSTKFFIKILYLSKKFEYSENGINIWRIFKEDWFSSFAGSTLMNGLFCYRSFKNISIILKHGAVITYLAENQAWEKAMNFAFHEDKKQKVIGILHTSVPLLLLTFFDFKDDLQDDNEKEFALPRPDYLACNGRIPLELIQESGWERKRAFLWFAIRYQNLKKNIQKEIPWENRQNKILVALSSSFKESEELLCYIHQAFSNQKDYQIVIKEHYAVPVNSLIRRLNLDFDKDPFIFSYEELDRLLSIAKAMVVTGSAAALESVAFGCPVIIPRLSRVIDMNPLSGISDLPFYVSSPQELRAIVDEIIQRKDSPIFYEKYKNFIENYFEFSDSENELIEKLERCFKVGEKTL